MNASATKILSGPAGYAIVVGVGAIVLYVVYRELKKGLTAASDFAQGHKDAFGNVIAPDSAYNAGGVGALGATANAVSGGTLEALGEWIGGKISDWTGPDLNLGPQPVTMSGGDINAGQSNNIEYYH